jgi:hypothetical protein
VGVTFSKPIQTSPGPIQLPVSYVLGLFPGVKWPRCGTGPHLHIAPNYINSRAIPLLPLLAFMTCSNFTFNLLFYSAPDYIRLNCSKLIGKDLEGKSPGLIEVVTELTCKDN